MPRLSKATPKYRHHRASGHAVVNLSGVDHYLGPHGTRASKREYDRLVGEWLAAGRESPALASDEAADITITEVAVRYWRHAAGYYQKNGKPTGTLASIKAMLKVLRARYGALEARRFGPLSFQALKQHMIEKDWARAYVNDHLGRVRRMFKWAAAQELIPASVYQALTTVPGVRSGRGEAREPAPIGPVALAMVAATLPHLPSVVSHMVQLQLLTGMRPGEVCILRPCDVDRSTDPWQYRPSHHKTEHRGRSRVVFIGPQGQDVLRSYLLRDAEARCFDPSESEAKRKSEMRARRKTKVQPSQQNRRKRRPKVVPGNTYDVGAYRRAITRACDKAFPVPKGLSAEERKVWLDEHRWSPNQLRHTRATEVRRQFGLEAASTVLGHARADVTQIYAERDMAKAAEIMKKIG